MAVTVPVLLLALDIVTPPGPLTLGDRARRLAPGGQLQIAARARCWREKGKVR